MIAGTQKNCAIKFDRPPFRTMPGFARREVLILFRRAAIGQMHPETVVSHALLTCAAVWADPKALSARELLTAKRVKLFIEQNRRAALELATAILTERRAAQ